MTNTPSEWIKSTYSGGEGECLEWSPSAVSVTGSVPVRDSKVPGGPTLMVSAGGWTAFVMAVRDKSTFSTH